MNKNCNPWGTKERLKRLFESISNDVFAEGQIGNCRWIYYGTDNPAACGVLSLASADSFDRWANSRIVEVNTVLWETTDPDFEAFVISLINLF